MCNKIFYSANISCINNAESILDNNAFKITYTEYNNAIVNFMISGIINYFNSNIKKVLFCERDNKYIYYIHDARTYVDINHILYQLNLSDNQYRIKYNQYRTHIQMQLLDINRNDYTIKRDLIDINTMHDLILSTDSTFTNNYKAQCIQIAVTIYCIVLCVIYINFLFNICN